MIIGLAFVTFNRQSLKKNEMKKIPNPLQYGLGIFIS